MIIAITGLIGLCLKEFGTSVMGRFRFGTKIETTNSANLLLSHWHFEVTSDVKVGLTFYSRILVH